MMLYSQYKTIMARGGESELVAVLERLYAAGNASGWTVRGAATAAKYE